MTDVLRLLGELIALPSVNPAFASSRDAGVGEQAVAGFLAATAGLRGLEVEFREVLPGRPNLLVRLTPSGRRRRRILLAPHLDTIGCDDPRGFEPRQQGARLYGRGACDTKGSVAAMFGALLDLAESADRPKSTEVVFAGLMDEENGQAGSRALAGSGFRADLAIVGEPTRLEVVTAHKGDLWLELETQGRAAHGSRPELGDNAVHTMARIVCLLETEYARGLRRRRHPLLGQGTVNVGSIRGGVQPNVVPDRCVISVDRRTLPGETDVSVRREIRACLRRHGLAGRLTDLRGAPCPALETDPRQPLVQALLRTAGQRRAVGVHYFCDAAVLAAGGTPSVVFGPGDIAQAHTAEEWVDVRQVERARDLLVRYLQRLE